MTQTATKEKIEAIQQGIAEIYKTDRGARVPGDPPESIITLEEAGLIWNFETGEWESNREDEITHLINQGRAALAQQTANAEAERAAADQAEREMIAGEWRHLIAELKEQIPECLHDGIQVPSDPPRWVPSSSPWLDSPGEIHNEIEIATPIPGDPPLIARWVSGRKGTDSPLWEFIAYPLHAYRHRRGTISTEIAEDTSAADWSRIPVVHDSPAPALAALAQRAEEAIARLRYREEAAAEAEAERQERDRLAQEWIEKVESTLQTSRYIASRGQAPQAIAMLLALGLEIAIDATYHAEK